MRRAGRLGRDLATWGNVVRWSDALDWLAVEHPPTLEPNCEVTRLCEVIFLPLLYLKTVSPARAHVRVRTCEGKEITSLTSQIAIIHGVNDELLARLASEIARLRLQFARLRPRFARLAANEGMIRIGRCKSSFPGDLKTNSLRLKDWTATSTALAQTLETQLQRTTFATPIRRNFNDARRFDTRKITSLTSQSMGWSLITTLHIEQRLGRSFHVDEVPQTHVAIGVDARIIELPAVKDTASQPG